LAALWSATQWRKPFEELGEMFLRQMHKLHARGDKRWRRIVAAAGATDALIALLQDVTRLVVAKENGKDCLAQIGARFQPDPTGILDRCGAPGAGRQQLLSAPPWYRSQRAVCFHFLESVP
jgi:hypothetical protein